MAAPASCAGAPTAATVLVHVSVTGEVLGAPSAYGSNCVQFNQAAAAYAQDMRFSPATKNNQNVSAWIRILVQPRR
jgi:TonB family protein